MLTKNKELAIEYLLQGANQTDAVFKAYDCKNKNSASALATKLFKQEEVKKRLSDKREKLDEATTEINASFIDQVMKAIPARDVIAKLKANLNSNDARSVDQAIDKYVKIIGGYKDKQTSVMTLFQKIVELKEDNQEQQQNGEKQLI